MLEELSVVCFWILDGGSILKMGLATSVRLCCNIQYEVDSKVLQSNLELLCP